eukprot:CAMPEP_0194392666 /NCGR_PEP_ID=MMETSP0174-20130528/122865_1 /TAXON_ID=216777 /ORGANISM="Proboscia alata, Strain PI-D3" /LENGTH=178 /DNA_ID=CAMNT_0039188257 /DNA_START=404 /DNA_END=940 /DNA_ORIENTATION=+
MVKCSWHEQGCVWTGSIIDASAHLQQCQHNENRSTSITEPSISPEHQETISRLEHRIVELEDTLRLKEQQILRIKRDGRLRLPSLFSGDYYFKRETVVKLSQLLSRYLENKPEAIDSSRIYNCVRKCFLDLQKDYSDNPAHYYVDMRMLLATCKATSGWWTDKQQSNISSWMSEMDWN